MKKILNIAHRGNSSEFPENTLLAFDEALKAGADGFECDLRLTADGKVVVFHDDSLKRLCGVPGSVETSTWRDLQSLKVKGKESIPTLEALLQTFLTSTINLEIKFSARDAVVVEAVLRDLTKVRPQGRILFSSFSPEVLNCLSVMDPERKLGELGVLVESKNLKRLPETLPAWHPNTWNTPVEALQKHWIEDWKDLEIPSLWIWTLDDIQEWKAVLQSPLPFGAIITNRPKALSAFLEASS